MIKYRIVEKEFGDGRIEFFPEVYGFVEWCSLAELQLKAMGKGYKNFEAAQIKIDEHKKLLKEQEIVKTTVHEIN